MLANFRLNSQTNFITAKFALLPLLWGVGGDARRSKRPLLHRVPFVFAESQGPSF